ALLQAALGDVAKAVGMTEVSRRTGLGRESLYKALSANSAVSFKTVAKVAAALGARIEFAAVEQPV
ncbi:MAG: putative addiction module antidote protein, partial [Bifidobacteriaceae bacterium]|nr:putative addiction module antidote protein [Bifidobacteriaceae bacterium]